jgi:cell wall assembly regulator SMI1
MQDLIQRLDNILKQTRPEYYQSLLPGLSQNALSNLEKGLGMELPPDFKEFYRWKNGENLNNFEGSFLYNFQVMPDEEIISNFTFMKDLTEGGEFELANWWDINWIPFLHNGAGDHYCIDLAGSFNGKVGQILIFYHDWELRKIFHESFYKWLETVVIALEGNFLPYGDSPTYNTDYDKYEEFLKKNNLGYPIKTEAG